MENENLLKGLEQLSDTAVNLGMEPAFVLLRDKRAFHKGWPNLRPSLDEVLAHVKKSDRHAIGIQPASLGLVVLDCDEGAGPHVAADAIREKFGDVVACVTQSSSGRVDRGHVWIRCSDPSQVRNWNFAIEGMQGRFVRGEMRSHGGQIRLVESALAELALRVFEGGDEVDPAAFKQLRTSSVVEVDSDFDVNAGRPIDSCEIAILQPRLQGPEEGPRYQHLHALAGDMKRYGVSFNAAHDLLIEHVPFWVGEDGDTEKFAHGRLASHLSRTWSKLPRYIPPQEDFDDLIEDFEQANATTEPTQLPAASRQGQQLKLTGKGDNAKADSRSFENALIAADNMPCTPRWNDFKQEVTLDGPLPWGEDFGRDFNDNVLRLTREYFMVQHAQWSYEPSRDNVFEAVTTAAYKQKFHPVRDYLDMLVWDDVPRIHRLFADGFGCEDDEFSESVSRIFMIGAVARVFRPGCKVDTMPVIQGPQGTGKSSGLRDLASEEWFSDSELGDLKSKDAAINLQGTWIQEIAELDKMSNADVGTMKAFISRANDKYRGPYDKKASEHPRQTVFAATLNEEGYLRDDTGNRRYLPLRQVEGAEVDLDWINENRDQLWAEAKEMFDAGEDWVLPRHLWPVASDRQEAQTTLDPWEEEIAEFLRQRESGPSDFANNTGKWDADYIQDFEFGITPPAPGPADRFHSHELFQELGFSNVKANKGQAQRVRRLMGKFKDWEYQRSLRIGDRVAAGYIRRNT